MGEKGFCLPYRVAILAVTAACCACSAFTIVVMHDPLSAQEHLDLGLAYELKGDIEGARREYTAASRKDPSWALPYFNLGNLAYKQKDLKAAERLYEEALGLAPDNPGILNNLALAKFGLGEREKAIELARRAAAIGNDPAYLDTLRTMEQGGTAEGTAR